jgi:putative hemin transport protein
MNSNGLQFDPTGPRVPAAPVRNDHCSVREPADSKAFQDGWARLGTTEDFCMLIERFGVTDFEALQLAGEIWAARVTPEAFVARLRLLAELEFPCTLSFGRGDSMNTHRVVIDQVQCRNGCLHLLGDELCFILRKDCMDTAWVVTRPCADGVLISLELYDKEHELVVRLSGQPEQRTAAVWQDIIGTLPIMARNLWPESD